MVSTTLTLLALSAAVFAHPSHNKRQHHHHFHAGSGVGTGFPIPTGGLFRFNGTGPFNGSEFGAGPSGTPAVTLTVLPLPAAASTPDASIASPSVGDAAAEVNPAAVSSTSCSSSSTTTTTMTSLQYFTVTVSGESTPASSADVSVSVDGASSPVSSLSSPTSSAAVSATAVSAGAFFGQPSGTFSFSAPSVASSSIATTFATMPSPVSSSPSSVVSSSVVVSSVASPQASVVASSSAPSSSSSTPVSTVTASSGKKGLSYNTASLTNAFAGDGISWAYNWAASEQGSVVSGAEYVPMLWGLDATSGWASAAQTAISSGSSHALSFNEPDLSSQSNISPADAATNHIKYMNPLAGSVQIGSPAITNGAGTSPLMGIDWLNAFFTACAGNCKVDFVAFHWYNDASLISDLKTHVQDVINAAAQNGVSKVWLTEFGATGAAADVATFLSEAVSFLDSTPAVERYAYFMCSDGILVDGTSISSLGETYVA